jgi:uncharacterized protein (TIGR03435 family)
MTERVVRRFGFSKKLLLIMAGLVAVAMPIVFSLVLAAQIRAQEQTEGVAAKLPVFDVVSIKQADPRKPGCFFYGRIGDEYRDCGPLSGSIEIAYGFPDDRVLGLPGWTKSTYYDIDAKVASSDIAAFGKLNENQIGLMLQPVMKERFHLAVHYETEERSVYFLVIAKSGSKLKNSKRGDEFSPRIQISGNGKAESLRCTMSVLARFLSWQTGRTVIDQTGLTGGYEFTLNWTPDQGLMRDGAPSADDSGPSLFTALQEQLGLKLVSGKAPLKFVVVDHIEQPSPN